MALLVSDLEMVNFKCSVFWGQLRAKSTTFEKFGTQFALGLQDMRVLTKLQHVCVAILALSIGN